jgi:hypothetical protein
LERLERTPRRRTLLGKRKRPRGDNVSHITFTDTTWAGGGCRGELAGVESLREAGADLDDFASHASLAVVRLAAAEDTADCRVTAFKYSAAYARLPS